MNTLHNPNCLLSPTRHHIYNCEGDTCTCKFCNLKQGHLVTYIDNTTLADRQFRNRDLENELLELSLIK